MNEGGLCCYNIIIWSKLYLISFFHILYRLPVTAFVGIADRLFVYTLFVPQEQTIFRGTVVPIGRRHELKHPQFVCQIERIWQHEPDLPETCISSLRSNSTAAVAACCDVWTRQDPSLLCFLDVSTTCLPERRMHLSCCCERCAGASFSRTYRRRPKSLDSIRTIPHFNKSCQRSVWDMHLRSQLTVDIRNATFPLNNSTEAPTADTPNPILTVAEICTVASAYEKYRKGPPKLMLLLSCSCCIDRNLFYNLYPVPQVCRPFRKSHATTNCAPKTRESWSADTRKESTNETSHQQGNTINDSILVAFQTK